VLDLQCTDTVRLLLRHLPILHDAPIPSHLCASNRKSGHISGKPNRYVQNFERHSRLQNTLVIGLAPAYNYHLPCDPIWHMYWWRLLLGASTSAPIYGVLGVGLAWAGPRSCCAPRTFVLFPGPRSRSQGSFLPPGIQLGYLWLRPPWIHV
jgi:hypothetical protein